MCREQVSQGKECKFKCSKDVVRLLEVISSISEARSKNEQSEKPNTHW